MIKDALNSHVVDKKANGFTFYCGCSNSALLFASACVDLGFHIGISGKKITSVRLSKTGEIYELKVSTKRK